MREDQESNIEWLQETQKLAKQYNDQIQQYNLELPQAVEDDILSGQFPWSSLQVS